MAENRSLYVAYSPPFHFKGLTISLEKHHNGQPGLHWAALASIGAKCYYMKKLAPIRAIFDLEYPPVKEWDAKDHV